MAKPITETALLSCDHMTGIVIQVSSQSWVKVAGSKVLVGNDPGS